MARAPEVRLAGIPVRFEPVFFVIILLLGLPQSPPLIASWVVIATVSVLVHELGHAVAFRAYGLSPRIVLHGLGGLTSGEGELSPAGRIVTSLAGPLAALVLLGLPALALDASDLVTGGTADAVLRQAAWINIGWSVLNLVPVLPLDGGQVFLAVCDLATRGRGRRAAQVISVTVAAVLGIWAYRRGFLFGAVLAGALAAMNLAQLRKVRHDELADQLGVAHRALLAGRFDEADRELAAVARSRAPADVAGALGELQVWRAVLAHQPAAAEEALASLTAPERQQVASPALQAAVALAVGRREEGSALAAWSLAHEEARSTKGLLAAAVAATGAVALVAEDLRLMGPEGREASLLLRNLLVHLGHVAAAADVVVAPDSTGTSGAG